MVIVWLVVQVLFACLFFSLPAFVETPATEHGETTPLVQEKLSERQLAINTTTTVPHNYMSWAMRLWYLVKEETVVVLAVLFVVMFEQTALEVCTSTCIVHVRSSLVFLVDHVCSHGQGIIGLEGRAT